MGRCLLSCASLGKLFSFPGQSMSVVTTFMFTVRSGWMKHMSAYLFTLWLETDPIFETCFFFGILYDGQNSETK